MWCAIVPDCTLLNVNDETNEDFLGNRIVRNDLWRCNDVYPDTCKSDIDPDISGFGIIIAFTISALIVLAVVVTGYVVRQMGNESFNIIDYGILSIIHRKKIRKDTIPPRDWSDLYYKTVLMLSDQQLVTGIAILTAAFAQMCTINTYHFQICTFLAWIAGNTHMLALTSLRPFLKARPSMLRWRLVGILINFGMLLAALVLNASTRWPSSYDDQQLYYDSPARCAWNKDAYSDWEDSIIFSIVVLCIQYTGRMLRLFDNCTNFGHIWLRDKPSRLSMKILDRLWRNSHRDEVQRHIWRMLYSLYWGFYLVLHACMDLSQSYFAEIIWLVATLFWGFCKLFIVRRDSPLTQYENVWGFGQVVALGLLILPIMAAHEIYHDVSLHHRENAQRTAICQHHSHSSPELPEKQAAITSPSRRTSSLELFGRPRSTLSMPKRAATDISAYSPRLSRNLGPELRFTNTLPSSFKSTSLQFHNSLPNTDESASLPSTNGLSTEPATLHFSNTLPTIHTSSISVAPIPTAPHHTSPYTSLYYLILPPLILALCLYPFGIFIELVFALSNQFTADALTAAFIFWGICLGPGLLGWVLVGMLGGSGLWGADRKRRGLARWVVAGGMWIWTKIGGDRLRRWLWRDGKSSRGEDEKEEHGKSVEQVADTVITEDERAASQIGEHGHPDSVREGDEHEPTSSWTKKRWMRKKPRQGGGDVSVA